MTGKEQLLACLKGNLNAMTLMMQLQEISHTWDDLIDKDKPIAEASIHRAFWIALVGMQRNPFYVEFQQDLLPILESGIFNYVASVDLERHAGHARQLAHTARYAIGDVALVIARLVGGVDWAISQAPALKLLLQNDTLEDFNQEMDGKYGTTP